MGFLKKLLGIGVTAGATVAAVRIADKYKENNPDGVKDANGDGKVDALDVLSEVKKAATEVYNDAAAGFKEKAPVYAQQVKDAVDETFGGGDDAAAGFAGEASETAQPAEGDGNETPGGSD